jgi:hypothetical protein
MYTDPGSGLLLTQIIGIAILALAYRFRRAIGIFKRSRKRGITPSN